MEEQLRRIADALERLVDLKEVELSDLDESDDETGDDVQPASLTYLNGQRQ